MEPIKILAPIDATENSGNGLKYAIDLAKASDIELDIFHVLHKGEKTKIPHEEIIRSSVERNKKLKEIIREGDIPSEIIQLSLEIEPEVIIMSPNVFNKEKKYFDESDTG
ncbi:MAG: universal stress protein, partial [Proteobacteria bacterium]